MGLHVTITINVLLRYYITINNYNLNWIDFGVTEVVFQNSDFSVKNSLFSFWLVAQARK